MYYGSRFARGDYYQGDYYQGDPGFFSFLGGLAKSALGLIPGVGPAASTVLGGVTHAAGSPKLLGTGAKLTGAIQKIGPIATRMVKSRGGKIALGAGGALAAGAAGAALMKHHMAGERKRGRRMNVTNVKALRRSIRRCQGFSRLAVKVLRFTHPHKVRGRAYFKPVRRRKKVC